jgi:dolichyl-phosphate-mannose-protein mannosyltransferase
VTTAVAPAQVERPANTGWRHLGARATGALLPLGLALATIALRVPLLAPRLAHWDAVNYALGLHSFDIAAHQPHPPGSPYFILLGRVALSLIGDDNRALEAVSVLASAAAVALEYGFARLLFGSRRAALLAALLLMTQPIFWGYGTTASAWTVLALCAIGIGSVCLRLLRGNTRLMYPSALLLGLVSGFRADAAVFLAPLWLWCLFAATRSSRTRGLAVAMAAGAGLIWLIPVAMSAGGAISWGERLVALLPSDDMRTPRQFAVNTAIAYGTLAFTLGPSLLMAVIARGRLPMERRAGAFLALWIVPAFTFLWLVDSTEPGHDLVFAGAVAVLAAALVGRSLASGALLVGLQVAVFLFAAPMVDRPLAWTADSMLLNVTAPGLRQQQLSLASALQILRTFDPSETEVLTLVGQDPYRFLMYYLPEYSVVRLDPAAHSTLRAQGNWTETACLPLGRDTFVVLSAPTEPGTVPDGATRLSADEGSFQVWQLPSSAAPMDYLGFRLGDCA